MIEIIKASISNQNAEIEVFDNIYSNNKEQYLVHFVFIDDSWDNYNKIVVFDRVKNYDTPIGIDITSNNSRLVEIINDREFYCVLPWEVITQAGYFNISINGSYTNENGELVKKNFILPTKFTIQDGGDTTVYPRVPTPNMYEQLGGYYQSLKSDVEEANEKAAAASQKVDEYDERIEDIEKALEEGAGVGKETEEGGIIFGDENQALAENAVAFGTGTIASGANQMVIGKFNSLDKDEAFVVGNGQDNQERSNAFVVYKDGSEEYKGNLKVNGKDISNGGSGEFDEDIRLLFTEPELDWGNEFNKSKGGEIYIHNNEATKVTKAYIQIGNACPPAGSAEGVLSKLSADKLELILGSYGGHLIARGNEISSTSDSGSFVLNYNGLELSNSYTGVHTALRPDRLLIGNYYTTEYIDFNNQIIEHSTYDFENEVTIKETANWKDLLSTPDKVNQLQSDINSLDGVLNDILEAIRSDISITETIEIIEQIIVSYLENKTISEVEE